MRLITTILPSIKITHFLSLGVGTLYYFEIGHTNFTFGGNNYKFWAHKNYKTVLGVAEVITKYQNMRVWYHKGDFLCTFFQHFFFSHIKQRFFSFSSKFSASLNTSFLNSSKSLLWASDQNFFWPIPLFFGHFLSNKGHNEGLKNDERDKKSFFFLPYITSITAHKFQVGIIVSIYIELHRFASNYIDLDRNAYHVQCK